MYMHKNPSYKAQKAKPSRVKEPVQVYLDGPDRDTLEQVAEVTGLSRAEVLRRGLRHFAAEALASRSGKGSLDFLIGIMGEDPSIPTDLAEHHDRYLIEADAAHERESRVD